jgi:GNAT superfamily N-acetyltransferase
LIAREQQLLGRGLQGFDRDDVATDGVFELRENGFDGWCAFDADELVGVMCVRTIGQVAFVPAHGFALRSGDDDPTSLVVAMLAEVTEHAVRAGALRITLDHVDAPEVGEALHRAGFGGASVFAVRTTSPMGIDAGAVSIRRGGVDDLTSIGELSHIEFMYRFAAPLHALQPNGTLAETRAAHAKIISNGGVHLIAALDGRDVGLLTLESTSPAPRLCPDGAYIGPTATRPDVRNVGVASALVAAAVDEARSRGLEHIGVDFSGNNPISRPFWLRRGFTPTGFRLHRVLRLGDPMPAQKRDHPSGDHR